MITLAVMQGRLGPSEDGRIQCSPRLHWREEFPRAAELKFHGIEWIDDLFSADVSPLRSQEGILELRMLITKHGVRIPSVCANIFIEEPLIRCTDTERRKRLQHLIFLLHQAQTIGARHLLLPLLDSSELRTEDEIKTMTEALRSVLPDLDRLSMEIHLETSLAPSAFQSFLDRIDHPRVRVTYDTGNSAFLGYDPEEEFAAYGTRIGSVHVKDKKRGGGTVKLGTGDTDFTLIARELRKQKFGGLFTLEAARGEPGKEVELLEEYREFAEQIFGAK